MRVPIHSGSHWILKGNYGIPAGRRHRAISVFIFSSGGEVMLQKRAAHKYHCAGLWPNTCCTHSRPHEIPAEAEPTALVAKAMASHSWLREFLITRTQGERNPFEPTENIQIVITDEAAEEA